MVSIQEAAHAPLTLTLSRGLRLSYAVYGDPSLKRCCFYFHGFPGSRLEAAGCDQKARAKGLSILAFDRPGFGLSESVLEHSPTTFAYTMRECAGVMGISKYAVLGVSGGTPYALACAAFFPQQVSGALIVSGMAEYNDSAADRDMIFANRLLLQAGRHCPRTTSLLVKAIGWWVRKRPLDMLRWFRTILCEEDGKIMRASGRSSLLARNVSEALRQGSSGPAREFLSLCHPWQVPLHEIQCPVRLIHGDADWYVPVSMAQRLRDHIRNAQLQLLPGQGHFMGLTHVGLIIDAVDELTPR